MRHLLIILVVLWGFSSCTTNATFTFHKNQTTSLLAEVDMEGILKFTGDSIMKSFTNKELSKNWKSLYQISKEKAIASEIQTQEKIKASLFETL